MKLRNALCEDYEIFSAAILGQTKNSKEKWIAFVSVCKYLIYTAQFDSDDEIKQKIEKKRAKVNAFIAVQ